MDRFGFFFSFYGLILGLAITELLSGLGGMVRAHALKKLEAQTALLALLVFVAICTTWIDAWDELKSVDLVIADLWAPLLLATCYYLAADVVFPREREQYAHLRTYFAARKRFVIGLVWVAVLLETFADRRYFVNQLQHDPRFFWAFLVPYNVAVQVCFLALMVVRARRPIIALLIAQIALGILPYWGENLMHGLVAWAWA